MFLYLYPYIHVYLRILLIYETAVSIKSLMGILRAMQDQWLGYVEYRIFPIARIIWPGVAVTPLGSAQHQLIKDELSQTVARRSRHSSDLEPSLLDFPF
jgi:hypothetical protein